MCVWFQATECAVLRCSGRRSPAQGHRAGEAGGRHPCVLSRLLPATCRGFATKRARRVSEGTRQGRDRGPCRPSHATPVSFRARSFRKRALDWTASEGQVTLIVCDLPAGPLEHEANDPAPRRPPLVRVQNEVGCTDPPGLQSDSRWTEAVPAGGGGEERAGADLLCREGGQAALGGAFPAAPPPLRGLGTLLHPAQKLRMQLGPWLFRI